VSTPATARLSSGEQLNKRRFSLRAFYRNCGPGVISGAANDDPSCIITYSIAGATFGYLTLWTSLFTLPLLAAVQLMCSRLGLVTKRGLARDVRMNYPKWILFSICTMLLVANTVTIGADLGGMAEVTQMVSGISSYIWAGVYAALIIGLLLYFPYRVLERVFKWLCLVLFVYVASGILARPDWRAVLLHTFIPSFKWSSQYLSVLVAIIGATMSPYFLFWQVSQEVESEYCHRKRFVNVPTRPSERKLERSKTDVFTGSFISKLITYFITLTTAATLFAHGKTEIGTAKDAAAALGPIAGPAATWLFAAGVIGTGLLAIPTLAGSSAYAVSEAFRWRASLEAKVSIAPKFYRILVISALLGVALIYAGLRPVQMLFWASVFNGLLAPPSIALVILLTRNPTVMADRVNTPWMNWCGWIALALTSTAAIAMLASFAH
jgi:NRAMP (natural resistance-associated macrophage protein)-like metal ion transporter